VSTPNGEVPQTRPMTMRQLMSHTAGFDVSGGYAKMNITDRDQPLQAMIDKLAKLPLPVQPGSDWRYGPSVDIQGYVVEKLSGQTLDVFLKNRIFDPLGMKDTFFYPSDTNSRIATLYEQADGSLRKAANPAFMNGAYLSGGGGLYSTAEDYLQFALMLLNRGQLDGKRLLGTRTVDLMASVFAPDTLPGRLPGEGFGLSVRVVDNPAARNTYLSKGSFGWSGAFNTHFFIDPTERIVALFMTQIVGLQSRGELRDDFETAVMQSIVGGGTAGTH
jgi:CubicO group peptidase (beta-lactamase class C family)